MPTDQHENLLWRAWLWQQMINSEATRKLVYHSCKRDPLFYMASHCWTLDPRQQEAIIPFIPWDFQTVLVRLIWYNVTQSRLRKNRYRRWDIGIDKSRDMGITWTVLLTLDWFWRFDKNRSFRCISWKQEYVDSTDDDDALFQKLDFNEERLPSIIAVRGDQHDHIHGRPKMKIMNVAKRNAIVGEASGANAGRGGRNTAAFRDEEAFAENGMAITKSLNQTTRCQVRVSTPNGVGNSFHMAKVQEKIDWLTFHWSLHPDKSQGLYTIKNRRVKILDRKWHDANPRYKFVRASTYADPGTPYEFLRSPWFDGEVAAADSIYDIQQEIQISYLGTGAPWFRADKMQEIRVKNEKAPLHTGEIGDFLPLDARDEKQVFVDRDNRVDKCKLWFPMTVGGQVPQMTTYTMGIDIGTGNGGTSDSTISIGDDTTKEKVFEYRSNGITPEEFARLCIAVYKWFTVYEYGAPFMAWDAGGHGGPFGTIITTSEDPVDCFYWTNWDERKHRKSNRPGVPTNAQIKKQIFTDYRQALFNGKFRTPSTETYEQAYQFVHNTAGVPTHTKAEATEDNAEKGDQHGDVLTSEVILWVAMRERSEPLPVERPVPTGSMKARWAEQDRRQGAKEKRWYD